MQNHLRLFFASSAAFIALASCKADSDTGQPSGAGVTVGAVTASGSGSGSSASGSGTGGSEPVGCTNGATDGDETDVDCGGSCSAKCAVGKACAVGADCVERVCDQLKCVPPTCTDEVANGDEVDVDCGGTCAKRCGAGQKCGSDNDCADKKCDANTSVCIAATCNDVIQNGDETDIDCGGATCAGCRPGQKCELAEDCATAVCGADLCDCPQGMETVTVNGAGAYCVDAVEVTYGAYQDFVLANFPFEAPDMPDACKGGANNSWIPDGLWPGSPQATQQHYVQRPVRYVDYCDAAGYCLWKGRRLCGAIAGGPANPVEFTNPSLDQWFNACSAQGENAYPYGDAFNAALCVTGAMGTQPATVTLNCIGGFPALLNMSGNVAEWTDACQDPGTGLVCRVRGGSYLTTDPENAACDADDYRGFLEKDADVGFRCCLP